ncbi:MAG TPA: hypothetical protein VI423_06585 [Paenisporosarcina sp.]|nr:hypothetical protein [Paenisporosarcina sp.]
MKNYEELSKEAKQGLDNFRKALSTNMKGVVPHFEYILLVDGFARSLSFIVFGFCLSAGATMTDANDAALLARSKNYWL